MRLNLYGVKAAALAFTFACGVFGTSSVKADEGMWTYDNPPTKQLKEKFNFQLTPQWLEHIRLSSVRFNDGGSGSFVSPDGLVITNHHVAVGQIQKLSSEGNDLVNDGYLAADNTKELKCKDLELNVLIKMENVTDKIRKVAEGKTGREAIEARDNESARLEKEVADKSGLKGEIVSLYNGGEYWLYTYKKYTDVRLVFAPERQAAYFGGDYDNFCYPRWDLDITIFRVYEDDKPIKCDNYLKWNPTAPEKDQLVFISGHPGSTERLITYAQLENKKDVIEPLMIKLINNRINTLMEYSKLGAEQERRALIEIFGLQNSKKAMSGTLQGLNDPELMKKKYNEEQELLNKIKANPSLASKYGQLWGEISELVKQSSDITKKNIYHSLGSGLISKATGVLRYIVETQKADDERLEGYHEADLEGVKFRLLSKAPIYIDLEKAKFIGALNFGLENAPNDSFIKMVLKGKTPKQRADELFNNTKINDPKFREELLNGGQKALDKCTDPLIVLAKELDPTLREERKQNKEIIESKLVAAEEKIADARFAVYGKDSYPDATFTLRLTYGAVKGYPMNGTIAPFKTTLYGLFDRAYSFSGEKDFELPKSYWDAKDNLDLSKSVNFVSTCDIIGGNSGSPTINAKGEFVGIVFDGNIESLPGNFIYDVSKNRAVSCSAEYISYALRNIYKAAKLADELEGK